MMSCNMTNIERRDSYTSTRVILLTVVILLVISGNVILYLRHRQKVRKWSPKNWLLSQLALIGFLNGSIITGAYTIFSLKGKCAFGEVFCQLYGVISSVLISSWTWLLTIAAFERFLWLVLPSEHPSLFSEVNTRIMTWSSYLLMMVLYLGPIYGWGEYSHFRGKVDIILTMSNITSIVEENTMSVSLFGLQFYQTYLTLFGQGNISMERNIKDLPGLDGVVFRRPAPSAFGIVYPVRVSSKQTIDCLLDHYKAETLAAGLNHEVKHMNIPALFGVANIHLNIDVDVSQVREFMKVQLVYQDSAMCGLDYTPVNDSIYSFVAFSWFWALVLPFTLMFYFHIRSLFGSTYSQETFMADSAAQVDLYITKVLACSSVASFLCDVAYFSVNLAAGFGISISQEAHFAAHMLLYISWALPWTIFLLTSSGWECLGCCACDCICWESSFRFTSCLRPSGTRNSQGFTETGQEFEARHRLLSQVGGSVSNSPALSVTSAIVEELETIL